MVIVLAAGRMASELEAVCSFTAEDALPVRDEGVAFTMVKLGPGGMVPNGDASGVVLSRDAAGVMSPSRDVPGDVLLNRDVDSVVELGASAFLPPNRGPAGVVELEAGVMVPNRDVDGVVELGAGVVLPKKDVAGLVANRDAAGLVVD